MKRDEFYDRFPWLTELPMNPTCHECYSMAKLYLDTHGRLVLKEYHTPRCSRFEHHATEHVMEGEPCSPESGEHQ